MQQTHPYGMDTPLHAAQGVTIALNPQLALSLHHGNERRPAPPASVNMHAIRSAKSFVAFPADYDRDVVMTEWSDWIGGAKAVRSALPRSL